MRGGVTDVNDVDCVVCTVSKGEATELFSGMVAAIFGRPRVWRGRGKCLYKLVAGYGES